MEKDDIRNEARAILTQYIEEKKMRKTPERYAILDVVLETSGHYSAEKFQALMPSDFPVSRPTVYSTLQLLEELHIVRSHQLNGITLYEKSIGVAPHHHYICTECGEITDLIDQKIDYIISIAKTPRFSKEIGVAYIYGLCSKCKSVVNKKKKKEMRERETNMSREEKRFAKISKDLAKIASDLAKVGIGTAKK